MFLETISLFHETHFCLTVSGSQDVSNDIHQPQASLSLQQVEGGILRSIRLMSVSLHHFSFVFKLSIPNTQLQVYGPRTSPDLPFLAQNNFAILPQGSP